MEALLPPLEGGSVLGSDTQFTSVGAMRQETVRPEGGCLCLPRGQAPAGIRYVAESAADDRPGRVRDSSIRDRRSTASDGPAALDYTNQHNRDRDNEQNVNEP